MEERPFVAENARERERLHSIVGRLTDEELSLPMGTDWTVAVVLAHLAFWDQRSLVLIRKWAADGVAPCSIDIDVINESLLPLWLALPPRAAAGLAVSAAEAIDRELEEAPEELIAAIESLGERFRLYRSDHRKMHLDQIEEVLKNKVFVKK
ncbi:MAG: maleylpyruvate isomerase N-terminal domain-containing protein [Deltaproteobacteria bacterium]|nr:maleylpyruvate isomerase N-terminal domain-containing protein [Deltaproteobacteria bacterium]